jgi:hypothetical protein
MQEFTLSPRIERFSWGRLEVAGQSRPFKDAKLYPGGAREWDWRETGTQHKPGIQPADVEELLEHGAKMIILSRGMYRRLQVPSETLQFLAEKQIPTQVLPTEEAIRRYNELCASEPVGALIHSTC